MDPAARRHAPGRPAVAARRRRPPPGAGPGGVPALPQARPHPRARRAHPPLLRRARLRLAARGPARHRRLRRPARRRVPASGTARRRGGHRMAGAAALVHRCGGDDRQELGRLQRVADRGPAPAGAEGRGVGVLHRRPLRRRRPLHGRLPAQREPDLGHAAHGTGGPAPRPGAGGPGLARGLGPSAGPRAALPGGVDAPSPPRRLLASRLGGRRPRRRRLPGVPGGRLGRRLHQRHPAIAGEPLGAAPRADRTVGTPLSAPRHSRAGHRLPAGVPGLVGPLAATRRRRDRGGRRGQHGRGTRRDRRTPAARLDARPYRRPLGGRGVVAARA